MRGFSQLGHRHGGTDGLAEIGGRVQSNWRTTEEGGSAVAVMLVRRVVQHSAADERATSGLIVDWLIVYHFWCKHLDSGVYGGPLVRCR